jgi:hypothetical protein
MTPLIKIKISDLDKYLTSEQHFHRYTVKVGKRILTYRLKRILPSKGTQMTIDVKVMRKTKFVMSCIIDDEVYTSLESLKEKIEYKPYDKNKKPYKTIHK